MKQKFITRFVKNKLNFFKFLFIGFVLVLLIFIFNMDIRTKYEKDTIGYTEFEIKSRYGNPDNESYFEFGSETPEVELLIPLFIIHDSLDSNQVIQIKELNWNLFFEFKRTVWLEKSDSTWVVVNDMKYSKFTKF